MEGRMDGYVCGCTHVSETSCILVAITDACHAVHSGTSRPSGRKLERCASCLLSDSLDQMPRGAFCCPSVFFSSLPLRVKVGDHRVGAECSAVCEVRVCDLPGSWCMDCCTIAPDARYWYMSAVNGDTWACAPSLCAKYWHPTCTE
jgi:hypothetical protein